MGAEHTNDKSRFLEKLSTISGKRLTVLVAPSGWGKTRLLKLWVQSTDLEVAWLSLNPACNDPQHFLKHLSLAMAEVIPQQADQFASIYYAQTLESGIVQTINWFAESDGQTYALVLDGYQQIDNEEIHEAVRLLLDYMPPNLHLVVAASRLPPLPLPRLRVRRELLEVVIA
jgi:LuxR family maltose regulon positive regulatory protein